MKIDREYLMDGEREARNTLDPLLGTLKAMNDNQRLLWFSGFVSSLSGTMTACLGIEASLAILDVIKNPMLALANSHATPEAKELQ